MRVCDRCGVEGCKPGCINWKTNKLSANAALNQEWSVELNPKRKRIEVFFPLGNGQVLMCWFDSETIGPFADALANGRELLSAMNGGSDEPG